MDVQYTYMSDRINFRTDPLTKKRARNIFERMGLDLSTGLNVYLHYVAQHGHIPFEPELPGSGRSAKG
jgi:addiction module RelB/DinJ family antitoxin